MTYGAVIIHTGTTFHSGPLSQVAAKKAVTCTERLIQTLHAAGITQIVVVAGGHAHLPFETFDQAGCICLKDHSEDQSLLQLSRTGISLLMDTCERLFICASDCTDVDAETFLELMGKRADVVRVNQPLHHTASYPLLVNTAMARWILLYNGQRDLLGACESLVKINGARQEQVRLRKKRTSFSSAPVREYQPVINWV